MSDSNSRCQTPTFARLSCKEQPVCSKTWYTVFLGIQQWLSANLMGQKVLHLDNSQADLSIPTGRMDPQGQHRQETSWQREPPPMRKGLRCPCALGDPRPLVPGHSTGHCPARGDHTRLIWGVELIPKPRGDKGAARKVMRAAASIPHAFIRQLESPPSSLVPCQEGLPAHRTLR